MATVQGKSSHERLYWSSHHRRPARFQLTQGAQPLRGASLRGFGSTRDVPPAPNAANISVNRILHVRTSTRRPSLAAFLFLCFLSVQLAAAAYACAGSRYSVVGDMGGTAGMASMTESCPEMAAKANSVDDGLCLEHCQLGSKSADHSSPQIPPFQPILVSLVEPVLLPVFAIQKAAAADPVPRGPPRPLPILNCCFRT